MKREYVQQPHGNAASYSGAIRAGDLIVTAGQLAVYPGDPPMAFGDQVRLVLERLIGVIEEAGGGVETIIKVNAYLHDQDDFAEWDEIYREVIRAEPMPVRTTVQVGRLPAPMLIEVDAMAVARDA